MYLRLDEDEDKDRITVRSDEELQTMINGVSIWFQEQIDPFRLALA